MQTINERIQIILNQSNMTKTAFGEALKVSQQYISKLVKTGSPSDRLIEDICEKIFIRGKKINENWLRTGEGDMFLTLDRKEEIAQLTADLFKSEKDSFKSRLIMSLSRLSEEELAVLEKISADLAREKD